jgi:protein TonB
VPGSGGRGGGQARRASVSINVRNYNLAPWASDVLNRIQRNWSVAQTGESHWKGEVGIFVLMAKNGELLAIELESTSKIDVLDQAAMKSLQLSAPFPALPADFPNASLEMIFAFHYGD